MPRPVRLPLLLIALLGLLAAACSDDGELGGPSIGGGLAASVGSFEYTADDLEEEVELWAARPELVAQAFGVQDVGEPGRRSSELTAAVLSLRVQMAQGRQVADTTGFEPTGTAVEELLEQFDLQFVGTEGAQLFKDFSPEFRRRFAADFLYREDMLQRNAGGPVEVPRAVVDPRYGTFVDQNRGLGIVVPPTGPQPAPFAVDQ